ncbi:MAG: type II toxin-antitoxin system toxin DNA ADP-ribosyl transferase DarT [Desulfomonilaceae bacterium]
MTRIPTKIYKIFDGKNLRSILHTGCFYSTSKVAELGKQPSEIAHPRIMERRKKTIAPCGPGGTLNDYVPFYFVPRSPMLYAIFQGNVKEYDGNQERIILAVSTAQVVRASGLRFIFCNAHPIMEITEFFDKLEDLDKINWAIMRSKYWNDTLDQPDRKRQRQAEFLIYESFPFGLIDELVVNTERAKYAAEKMLMEFGIKIEVNVRPLWYF